MSSQHILKTDNHFATIIYVSVFLLLCCDLVGAQEPQKEVYQVQTSEQCSYLAGGSSITTVAECEQVAVRLGWSDVVVDSGDTISSSDSPPGCLLYYGNLFLNTLTTSTYSCSSFQNAGGDPFFSSIRKRKRQDW